MSLMQCTLLNQPPSCMVYSPEWDNLIVLGTYLLDVPVIDKEEKPAAPRMSQIRLGSLQLFEISENYTLRQIQCLNFSNSSVLDMNFSPHNSSLLGTAHSNGEVRFFRLANTLFGDCNYVVSLQECVVCTIFNLDTLVLSISFHPRDSDIVGVTSSNGEIALVSGFSSLRSARVIQKLNIHSQEAWTLSFDSGGSILYSGGDDSTFSVLDLRSQKDGAQQIFKETKTHRAGVTAILPVAGTRFVHTGSYDENVRCFDWSARRFFEESLPLGGGVWRLEEMPLPCHTQQRSEDFAFLGSCMHAGPRIVKGRNSDLSQATVLELNGVHNSMNYASCIHPKDLDWSRLATTSFYDKKLSLWNLSATYM